MNGNMNPKNINILYHLVFKEPTKEQVHALQKIEDFLSYKNSDDFMIVCGSAGTGKSSIMNAVVQYCEDKHIKVNIAAPTAKAARNIASKTGNLARTLHSLLFSVSTKPDKALIQYSLKTDYEQQYSVFIIDESSMINSQIVRNSEDELFMCSISLLNAIVQFAKSGNPENKVIFVGDRYQLPPVGEKHCNALYMEYLKKRFDWRGSHIELTIPSRFHTSSYIYTNAEGFRNSMMNDTVMPRFDLPNTGNLNNTVSSYLKELNQFGPNKVVSIAATHRQNNLFNHKLRTLRYGKNAPKLMKGDVINIKRNWKRGAYSLYNGDMALVMDVDYDNQISVSNLNYIPVQLKAKDMNNENVIITDYLLMECLDHGTGSLGSMKENKLYAERYRKNKTYRVSGQIEDDRYLGALRASYGYSITCNSAQGGEWDTVYLNTFYIPCPQWAYTGITRARNNLFIF